MYIVIDSYTATLNIPLVEKADVKIELVLMDTGEFGFRYEATWSGIRSGNSAGGPYVVTGNMDKQVNDDPPVWVKVSDWSVDPKERRVSMHVKVICDLSKYSSLIGKVTVFDHTLSGHYGVPGLQALKDALREQLAAV